MASSSGKKSKPKPSKLTEFFQPNSAQSSEPDKCSFQTLPADSADMDSQDSSATILLPSEPSMQQLLLTFRQQLQADFKSMISELKTDIHSLITRTEHVETKMAEFAKSHNSLIDSHSAL